MMRRIAVVKAALLVVYAAVLRRWQLRWGAPAQLVDAPLPGDEVVGSADLVATRAVRIDVPAERVWPWVVQLGQGRGGFYSYDALENLLGCEIRSADHIVADLQHLEVGDPFRLHPEVALQVVHVDVGRALVVEGSVGPSGAVGPSVPTGGGDPDPSPAHPPEPPYDFTWAFVLVDADDGGCWLVARERYGYRRWWSPLLVEPVAAASFVMTRRMLHGIRDRAQAHR